MERVRQGHHPLHGHTNAHGTTSIRVLGFDTVLVAAGQRLRAFIAGPKGVQAMTLSLSQLKPASRIIAVHAFRTSKVGRPAFAVVSVRAASGPGGRGSKVPVASKATLNVYGLQTDENKFRESGGVAAFLRAATDDSSAHELDFRPVSLSSFALSSRATRSDPAHWLVLPGLDCRLHIFEVRRVNRDNDGGDTVAHSAGYGGPRGDGSSFQVSEVVASDPRYPLPHFKKLPSPVLAFEMRRFHSRGLNVQIVVAACQNGYIRLETSKGASKSGGEAKASNQGDGGNKGGTGAGGGGSIIKESKKGGASTGEGGPGSQNTFGSGKAASGGAGSQSQMQQSSATEDSKTPNDAKKDEFKDRTSRVFDFDTHTWIEGPSVVTRPATTSAGAIGRVQGAMAGSSSRRKTANKRRHQVKDTINLRPQTKIVNRYLKVAPGVHEGKLDGPVSFVDIFSDYHTPVESVASRDPTGPSPTAAEMSVRANKTSSGTGRVNVLVGCAVGFACVFKRVEEVGLAHCEPLPRSNEWDSVTCGVVADLDMDGRSEIYIGTYSCKLLCYVSPTSISRIESQTAQASSAQRVPPEPPKYVLGAVTQLNHPVLALQRLCPSDWGTLGGCVFASTMHACEVLCVPRRVVEKNARALVGLLEDILRLEGAPGVMGGRALGSAGASGAGVGGPIISGLVDGASWPEHFMHI